MHNNLAMLVKGKEKSCQPRPKQNRYNFN